MRVVYIVVALALVGCASAPPAKYEIDRAIVEDIRDELLVAYGRAAGRMDVLCADEATPSGRIQVSSADKCEAGQELLVKLAAAYKQVKAALKTPDPRLDPELLKAILPLISKLAPLLL